MNQLLCGGQSGVGQGRRFGTLLPCHGGPSAADLCQMEYTTPVVEPTAVCHFLSDMPVVHHQSNETPCYDSEHLD